MRILFDNGTPAPLCHFLKGHDVVEAIKRGWDRLSNGKLIAAAEAKSYGQKAGFRCTRQSAMACLTTPCPQGYRRRERSYTR